MKQLTAVEKILRGSLAVIVASLIAIVLLMLTQPNAVLVPVATLVIFLFLLPVSLPLAASLRSQSYWAILPAVLCVFGVYGVNIFWHGDYVSAGWLFEICMLFGLIGTWALVLRASATASVFEAKTLLIGAAFGIAAAVLIFPFEAITPIIKPALFALGV